MRCLNCFMFLYVILLVLFSSFPSLELQSGLPPHPYAVTTVFPVFFLWAAYYSMHLVLLGPCHVIVIL